MRHNRLGQAVVIASNCLFLQELVQVSRVHVICHNMIHTSFEALYQLFDVKHTHWDYAAALKREKLWAKWSAGECRFCGQTDLAIMIWMWSFSHDSKWPSEYDSDASVNTIFWASRCTHDRSPFLFEYGERRQVLSEGVDKDGIVAYVLTGRRDCDKLPWVFGFYSNEQR